MAWIPFSEHGWERMVPRPPQHDAPKTMKEKELPKSAKIEDHFMRPAGELLGFSAMDRQRITHSGSHSREIRQRKNLPSHDCRKDIVPAAPVLGADHGGSTRTKDAVDFGQNWYRPFDTNEAQSGAFARRLPCAPAQGYD